MNVIVEIALDKIEVGERLRSVDPAWVEFLAASIAESGQHTPVKVRKVGRGEKYALIAGGHRMAAMKLAGKETVFADVVKANDLEAKLLEIDENLIRRELSALDKATFLSQRKDVYEQLHPETKNGGDRKSDQTEARFGLISFSKATAERLGLTERSVEIAVARHRNISGSVRGTIAGTWLADSGRQLDDLAKLTPQLQEKVAFFVIQHPDVKSVAQIVSTIENRPKPQPAGVLERFITMFRKADPDEQSSIVEYAAAQMPGVAWETAWAKGSEYHRESMVRHISPALPGFGKEAA